MYSDPITPRAHPDLLADVDYDPFNVMPAALPPAPRVFTTMDQIGRARQRLSDGSAIDRHCFDQLIIACKLDEPLPSLKPADGPPDWGGPLLPWLNVAFKNALAWQLTDDPRHHRRAVEAMRLAAESCANMTWTGYEHHEAGNAARAYDLLATSGLDPADDSRMRDMLWTLINALDYCPHRNCNNHNAMDLAGRLSLAAALGNRQLIHDVLYGGQRLGHWRYGIIHTLRHDFLADGMQWEGVPGYHMLVLTMVSEVFNIMENLGVDLWHRAWPALMQDDGFDEHRGWGPKGDKPFIAAIDALLYQTFPNGDYSLLHDQVLGNLRGTWVWWPLFNKAFEKYGEPRYAWALQQINRGQPATADGPVPVWFEGDHGHVEFVRTERRDYPAGEHPLAHDRQWSLLGRHRAGCSLFPMHGSALLRSDALDTESLSAYFYWGPHWAGHRSPAALHLDIHALGQRVTHAPHIAADGYGDPKHLTWVRSTIAHNTVCVDQQTMFPVEFETDSLWECDHWRDTISDGKLELFQTEPGFKAVRSSNDNVYRNVRLDRTVILTSDYLLDVYRVAAEEPRLLDWAMHCHGTLDHDPGAEPIDLGQNRGYRHLTDARLHPQHDGWVVCPVTLDTGLVHAAIRLDGLPDAQLIVTRDPEPDDRIAIGDLTPPQPHTCLIVRSLTASALFVSVWGLGKTAPGAGCDVHGEACGDVTVELDHAGRTHRWQLPMHGDVRRE